MRSIGLFALLLFTAPSAVAADQPPPTASVLVDGQVQSPRQLTESDLEGLTPTQIHASFLTGHGQEEGTFSDVLLWTLLQQAKIVDGPGKGAHLRHIVIVTGRDGYAVPLAIGELDPDFEGKSVIVAFAKAGAPLGPGLRIIVPGDHHAGRCVRDVVHIEVK
jgi:hypothetical protein